MRTFVGKEDEDNIRGAHVRGKIFTSISITFQITVAQTEAARSESKILPRYFAYGFGFNT